MNNQQDDITYLWGQFAEKKASRAEVERLLYYLKDSNHDQESMNFLVQQFEEHLTVKHLDEGYLSEKLNDILRSSKPTSKAYKITENYTDETTELVSASSIRRISFLRRNFFKYAAAILLIAGTVAYLWSFNSKDKILSEGIELAHSDIQPGSNKAMLTLSDGTTIALDSVADGTIANQGDVYIVKSSKGEILYNTQGQLQGDLMMNTMSTPNGGQYQLILPDGSKVWLNAASSITYPTKFTGSDRVVNVTGEVFIEVARNARQPFRVQVSETTIEVLGTTFNINAYAEQNGVQTTLVEGKVRVVAEGKSETINPGEMLFRSLDRGKPVMSKSQVNVEQTLAWKNGLFSFDHAGFHAVMMQLERWYDITVRYEGQVPDIALKGEMYRSAGLSDVLTFLQRMGAKLKMEGKTLIIQ